MKLNKFLLCLITLLASANIASANCETGARIKEGYYIIRTTTSVCVWLSNNAKSNT